MLPVQDVQYIHCVLHSGSLCVRRSYHWTKPAVARWENGRSDHMTQYGRSYDSVEGHVMQYWGSCDTVWGVIWQVWRVMWQYERSCDAIWGVLWHSMGGHVTQCVRSGILRAGASINNGLINCLLLLVSTAKISIQPRGGRTSSRALRYLMM